MSNLSFYNCKKVFVTGHTGFKGSWMCKMLIDAGADVTGYALEAPGQQSLFRLSKIENHMNSIIGDIRDLKSLEKAIVESKAEIVIHMAAQPLVRESYVNPVNTYDVNVMGTVHILECIRRSQTIKSFVNVTTDKVYLNREWDWGYRESEELNGYDPYSNSKSCSELVTSSYQKSFFHEKKVSISTARAGNVIGGGDFAADRIIPDCYRAIESKQEIKIRNPYSIRPYEHVLEPIYAYLLIAQKQYEDPAMSGSYNVGPEEADCRTTGELVTVFCNQWNKLTGDEIRWVNQHDGGPHEAQYLKLDCSKIKNKLGWKPRWSLEVALSKTADWFYVYRNKGNIIKCMEDQISNFISF